MTSYTLLVVYDGLCTVCGEPRYRPIDVPRHEPGPCHRCRPINYLPDITPPDPSTPWTGCRSCGTPIARAPGAGRPRNHCDWCKEEDT